MPVCSRCGRESVGGEYAFCPYCAAPFAEVPELEQRKMVTILFCDVTGSTALGESVDPEALRSMLSVYFERMKGIVESHGGTVEKFIGDAVLAVFGVPQVHEDDALRACRAAVEMRAALPELPVQARIGVNTGEVVTGTTKYLAAGDAVNVAARLEQAADPGEVLIGAGTMQLVRHEVSAVPLEPLRLKGKSQPVPAWRLLSVRESSERVFETPMIGRASELRRLQDAFREAVQGSSCQLFTVLGNAGVGKSRLVAEFLAGLETRCVRGRCLPYGRGITYWPVVGVIKQLDRLPVEEPAAASALRSLLGESEDGTSAEEIAWAFRRLLEQEAQRDPLVCVFDDLQWGEETFLDLVERVADLARDAPILLLCMARPELLERRPAWGGGKSNATRTLLEPLDETESEQLLVALGGVEPELGERISTAAEGNPFFLEELLAFVRDSGDELTVPPTIQALLAARLDQLDPAERAVLERCAVEGRVFHQNAVQAFSDDEPRLAERLDALVRKGVIRPDRAQIAAGNVYRFRHLLIRDAAYEGTPKALRAQLHERFADWLEQSVPDLVELDEILGHHLEQAAGYTAELGRPDAALAERAGVRLAVAGRRALWRADNRAAAGLLERALELTRRLRLDVALELDLTVAYEETPRRAEAVAEAAAQRARTARDRVGATVARVVAARYRSEFADDPHFRELDTLARAALPLLEHAEDHAGLVHLWSALGSVANTLCKYEEMAQAAEQALEHARLAGHRTTNTFGLAPALTHGPRPADQALETLGRHVFETPDPWLQLFRAMLLAMLGRIDEAWAVANSASERARELNGGIGGAGPLAQIAVLAGDHASAARYLRTVCDTREEQGQRALLSTSAPRLGHALCALGRHDEAEPLAQLGRELGDEQDIMTQMLWRQVMALVLAHRGEHANAETLARAAVALSDRTDALNEQGDARCGLAQVLQAAGHSEDAAATLQQALVRYERKHNIAMVAQVRERLAATDTTARSR